MGFVCAAIADFAQPGGAQVATADTEARRECARAQREIDVHEESCCTCAERELHQQQEDERRECESYCRNRFCRIDQEIDSIFTTAEDNTNLRYRLFV
jgi:hypothetical protein